MGVDAKAVEFDLVLPIVAGGHSFGQDRATGIDVLEEQDLKDVAALPGPGNWRHALALVLRNKDNGCDAFACSLRSLTPRICVSFPGRYCFRFLDCVNCRWPRRCRKDVYPGCY